MTNQTNQTNQTNPGSEYKVRCGCLAGLALALGLIGALSGCSEDPAPAPVAVNRTPPPPPEPEAPKVTPISELMARLRIDERISLPEDKAPATDPQRIAVLEFFDAFARGDDASLTKLMSFADALELRALVESGQWASQVNAMREVELVTGASEYGDCVLAIFTVGDTFQPLLWYYEGDEAGFTFEAAPQPPGIMERLSGTDWIKAWHDLLREEMAKADEPDEEFETPQRNLDESGGSTGGGSSMGGGGGGGGGARPGRRAPKKTPRKPPGP